MLVLHSKPPAIITFYMRFLYEHTVRIRITLGMYLCITTYYYTRASWRNLTVLGLPLYPHVRKFHSSFSVV